MLPASGFIGFGILFQNILTRPPNRGLSFTMKQTKFTLILLFHLFFNSFLISQNSQAVLLHEIIQRDREFEQKENFASGNPFPGISPIDYQRRLDFYQKELADLKKIKTDSLSKSDRINLELLSFVIQERIDEIQFKAYQVPLNAEGGWYTDFLLSADRVGSSSNAYLRYIRRLNGFRQYAEQQMANMREGLKRGRTAPYAILTGRENLVDHCVADNPMESPFYKPFLNMPDNLGASLSDSLRKLAIAAIDTSVTPAYKTFVKFWKNEYIPGSAKQIGISAQPNGKEYYEKRVQYFTTLKMTSQEVFDTGMKEVARIRKEMDEVLKETGFKGSFEEFLAFLRTDPQFYAKTPEELLKEASYISKKIDGKLPAFFGKLPRNPYGVSPVPEAIAPTYTSGRYSPGSPSNQRAGFYWVNTYNLPSRPLYALPALTLHEAVPGHHLQMSLSQELENVPDFRRNTYLSAYGEGWALYGEYLGEEMGIYSTPYERFGKLTYEMWRACRLVVDPGLHVMGWSRQKAIDFMASNTALSIHECTTEIDRYIGWPGQAVSYKIGELKIRDLRQNAEKALGVKFNLREFHDLVLSEGAVPLFTLERMVNEWIEELKAKN